MNSIRIKVLGVVVIGIMSPKALNSRLFFGLINEFQGLNCLREIYLKDLHICSNEWGL